MMKINKSQYEIIYNRNKSGESITRLAKEYGVNHSTINRIIEINRENTIDENSKLYKLKKDYEREKIIKKIKDLAEKYDIKITLNDEKDECNVCKKIQDILTENYFR